MSNIPSIPIPAPIQTEQIGTKIDPRNQLAAIGAAGDVAAQGLNTGLGIVADYEKRKQKAEEVAGFNAASIALNQATAAYQHNLKTMKDGDIVPQWQATSQKVKDQLLTTTQGWGPEAKAKFAQTLNNWQSDSTIHFQVASDNLSSLRRKATAFAAEREFLQTGDPEDMKRAQQGLKNALDAGDMTQEEYDLHADGLQKGFEMNIVQFNMENDPFSMKAALEERGKDGKYVNFTAIPATQRPTLLFRANRLENETRAQTMRDWRQAISDARDNGTPLPDQTMMEMEAKRQGIDPGWVKKALAPPKPELDQAAYAKDVVKLNHLNLQDDPSGANLAEATAIVSQYKGTAATNLEKIINDKRNPDHASNSPAATQIFKRMEGMHDIGVFLPRATGTESVPGTGFWGFGADKRTVMTDEANVGQKPDSTQAGDVKHWKDVAPRAVIDAEADHYATALTRLRAYIKANPKATDEDLTKYSHELTKPYVMATVGSMITPAAPGATYQSTKDVGDAFRAGKISRKEATDILKSQFHLE